jgi:hypothetical protein
MSLTTTKKNSNNSNRTSARAETLTWGYSASDAEFRCVSLPLPFSVVIARYYESQYACVVAYNRGRRVLKRRPAERHGPFSCLQRVRCGDCPRASYMQPTPDLGWFRCCLFLGCAVNTVSYRNVCARTPDIMYSDTVRVKFSVVGYLCGN